MITALKARVRAGRLIVDEPTDLPEGTELHLVIADAPPASEERRSVPDGDLNVIRAAMARAPSVQWLTPEERADCDQALEDMHEGRAKLVSHEEMFDEVTGADPG